MQALEEILRGNTHLLEEVEIEIDYISPSDPEVFQVIPINQFAHIYLKLKPGEQSVIFHSLRKLSLSGICFMYGIDDTICAFNFSQLRSLKLRDCLDTNPLLDKLAGSSQPIRLTSFELDFTGHYVEQEDIMPLVRFLRSFEGLEDLYILCPRLGNLTEEYWHSIFHHKSTLKRVVHQQIGVYLDPEYAQRNDRPIGALLKRSNLKCLGICCLPNDLVSKRLLCTCGRNLRLISVSLKSTSLARINPRPKFRLLHVRVTGYVTLRSIREDINERADQKFYKHCPNCSILRIEHLGLMGFRSLKS